MSEVAVVGGGAWGTALAIQAHRAGARVTLVLRDAERAAAVALSRQSGRLTGAVLPQGIAVVVEAPPGAALRVLAVPTQNLRQAAAGLAGDGPVLVCCKGIETGTGALPLDILREVCPGRAAMVLSGPNFAHEVAAGLPAAAVIAGQTAARRDAVAGLLGTASFRLYGNDDAIGVQIGGAAKNVIAIAAGAVIGAGLGENARAALVTRGLAEIARLAAAQGGRAATVAGLSGMGDLLLTCTGSASRNYSLGRSLGQGVELGAALAGIQGIAEGVTTAPALKSLAAGSQLDLPICAAVADLLASRLNLREAIAALLARPRRDE